MLAGGRYSTGTSLITSRYGSHAGTSRRSALIGLRGSPQAVSFPSVKRARDFAWLKDLRVITFSGVCVIAGFVVGLLIFGWPFHLPPAWGDIPTWLLALVGGAAGWGGVCPAP